MVLARMAPLALPALRAQMGDWVYYITFMRLGDISERVHFAEDIHTSKSLRDLLQRRLTNRSTLIRDYLLTQRQRFFNSLVIATYGGAPKWTEIDVGGADAGIAEMIEVWDGALGVLLLSGGEKLFAVDGQHRVAGIKSAVAKKKSLGDEEVGVVLVPGVSRENRAADEAGFERTRRLFSTLNREARAVNKRDIIALDEDDVIAILTRDLVDDYPLFVHEKVSPRSGNSIPPTDRTSFTTITAVYDGLHNFLSPSGGWKNFLKFRPSEAEIGRFRSRGLALYNALCSAFPAVQEMATSDATDGVAAKYRTDRGGHLLFRPIGLLMTIRVIRRLVDQGLSQKSVFALVGKMRVELSAEPWVNLLWDPINRRMITTPENQRVAERLLFYQLGGNLSRIYRGQTRVAAVESLRNELAGVMGRELEDFELPPPY